MKLQFTIAFTEGDAGIADVKQEFNVALHEALALAKERSNAGLQLASVEVTFLRAG